MTQKSAAQPVAPSISFSDAGQNLAGSLATRLRSSIVAGAHPPGTKLSIDELRAEFGVSLSPLREALSQLAAEGFVVLEEKKGFRVAPVSRENCAEVAGLQLLLEGKALSESIRRGDAAWEERVVLAFHRLERHEREERKSGRDIDEWERWHREFHEALRSACGMPLLLAQCASLHSFSARYRRLFLDSHSFDADVPSEHRAMMDAALDRDAKRAGRILATHIDRTAKNILAALGES